MLLFCSAHHHHIVIYPHEGRDRGIFSTFFLTFLSSICSTFSNIIFIFVYHCLPFFNLLQTLSNIFPIFSTNDSHFHLFYLVFSVWNWENARDNICYLVVMDQNLIDDDFSESGVNVDVPFRNTNLEGVKSNKCNQCNFVSFWAGNLRTHLKTHSGEKPNKCNQCDCFFWCRRFEETFENTQWRKV